ncbi:MAG: hypothetical protein JNJ90_09025 [Saprospiraceae bacterium]|jgi:hypothetical protein|nr:hypothetical protein [Saprospiraceae bacterium]
MFSFLKKTNEPAGKEQPDNTKSQLESIQESVKVLDKDEMVRVEGGKGGSKPFDQVFPWNSSCGSTIPQ